MAARACRASILRIGVSKVSRTFPGGFEHIETLGVDAGHLRRSAPAILPQRIAMVIVHVLNDSRFLRRGKWIFRHEFAGFYPADPSKSTMNRTRTSSSRKTAKACVWS